MAAIMGPRVRGTKLTYECATDKWHSATVELRISEEPFSEGGMRLAFRAREIFSDGDESDVVVKRFKEEVIRPEENERDLIMDEAMTQMVAEDYAQQFNRLAASKGLSHCLAFLPVSVVTLDDGSTLSMEPYLPGEYVKYSDNDGHVEREDEAASAYSYFTHHTSGGALVICDIQGVGTFYTDPQIHTLDGSGFGAGNLGEEGIERFMLAHRHTLLCERLGLPSPDAALSDAELAAKLQADEHRIAAEEEEAQLVAHAARLNINDGSERSWDSQRYKMSRSELARILGELPRGERP